MFISTISLLTLFSALYGTASATLHTLSSHSYDQPYRTAYHFQPPKNWINGIYITSFLQLILKFSLLPFIPFFLFFSFSLLCKYFMSLIYSFFLFLPFDICYPEMDMWLCLDLQIPMVSSVFSSLLNLHIFHILAYSFLQYLL